MSTKGPEVVKECGIDHILEAEKNGEITEANILYLIENLNGAGTGDLTTDLLCVIPPWPTVQNMCKMAIHSSCYK